MDAPPSPPLGRFTLQRLGGLLPPLRPVVKEIAADGRGVTRLGPVRMPFRVEPNGDGFRLRYPFPFGLLVDELRPEGDGTWHGDARLAGVRYGSFRMRPRCSSTT
jgi:hypothetical protein